VGVLSKGGVISAAVLLRSLRMAMRCSLATQHACRMAEVIGQLRSFADDLDSGAYEITFYRSADLDIVRLSDVLREAADALEKKQP
jgi:hypothetical protein